MRLFWYLAVTCTVTIAIWTDAALGQRRPIADDTLGDERSIVTPEDNIRGLPGDRIEGGARRGDNLFHSFQEFNIDTGRSVYFDDPGVQNILSRVTGGNVSEILGRLGILGDANLFLINPSGIIFGEGASLDVRGSFVGTTANAIQFGDQGFFSASEPNAPPLLTVQPSAFLFNQMQSGTIENRSRASLGNDELGNQVFGLLVPNRQSLVLLGGNIINSGNLNAFGGRVELGSVAGTGTVLLNADGSLGFPVGVGRSDVSLRNGIIDVAAGGGGSIAINARNIAILDRSRLQVGINSELGFVGSQSGDITLNATELIELVDSAIFSAVESGAVGAAGDITIEASSLFLRDGATIGNSTSGTGNAGRIDIIVTDILAMSGVDGDGRISFIFSSVGREAVGAGGDITIEASSLFLRDGATISNNTFGTGNAGRIDITVTDTLVMSGVDGDGINSFILSSVDSEAEGDAGDITIAADALFLRDGASINNSTFGRGDAGRINITVTDTLAMSGVDGVGINSFIESSVDSEAEGDAGDITIAAASLFLRDGASIDNSTYGRGDAGRIDITVTDTLAMSGVDGVGVGSSILSSVDSEAEGDAGDITIAAASLFLRDGVSIDNSTFGRGDAGSIDITVIDTLAMSGGDGTGGSFILSSVGGEEGDAGDITIAAASLFLRDGAFISNGTSGTGNAGSIDITVTDTLAMSGVDGAGRNSFIESAVGSEAEGDAGDITIAAASLFLRDGATISSSTLGTGNAGSIDITVTDTLAMSGVNGAERNSFIESGVDGGAEGDGGNITIAADSLFLRDGALLSVTSFGQGQAGNIDVQARDINLDNGSQISAETEVTGRGGNITLQGMDLLVLRNGSSISTTARTAQSGGDGGNITINADFIVAVPNEDSDIRADAFEGSGGNIDITIEGLFGIEARDKPTSLSDITASSELGVQGTININTPDVDPSRGLTELPADVVDASNQIAQTCPTDGDIAGEVGEFVVTGRGGVPADPAELLGGETVLSELAEVDDGGDREDRVMRGEIDRPSEITNNEQAELVEAQGWMVGADGNVVLTAETSVVEPHSSPIAPVSCPSS